MIRNKYLLSGCFLLALIVLLSYGQSMAVVPSSVSMEDKPEARTKEERLVEIIEKMEAREKANIEFYNGINNELKQISKKEGVGDEK